MIVNREVTGHKVPKLTVKQEIEYQETVGSLTAAMVHIPKENVESFGVHNLI